MVADRYVHFPPAEYEARLARTRTVMRERGIDCLVLTEPSNLCYLTGYDAWSFYVTQALIVGVEDGPPTWMGRLMDAPSARTVTHLPDECVRTYPDSYVQAADRHPMERVGALVEELGYGAETVGVEMGAYYYTARSHTELVKALPKARFVDAELLVNWVRIVKSEAEIAVLRQAGRIAEKVIERAYAVAAPGVRENDLVAAIYHQEISGTAEAGGVYTTSPPFVCIGSRTTMPHAVWTDEPMSRQTAINVEIAGCRHRYHTPISRTIYLGKPPETYRTLASHVIEGLGTALDAVRPGATCSDVELAWRRSLARHGIEKEARIGYTIGIGFPPTWGERTASLRPGDHTVLEPGMAFHMMTGLWLAETGVTITQSFVVTPGGHEPLTHLSHELMVKA
jgi:ectoine hydrolase